MSPPGSRPGETLRSLRLMVALAFSADPLRAGLVLVPVYSLARFGMEWTSREVVDGALRGDRSRLVAGLAVGALCALVYFVLLLTRFTMDMRLRERMGVMLDQRIIRGVVGLPTIDHHDDPSTADDLELLRTHRGMLLGGIGAVSNAVGTVADLVLVCVLLASVEPRALLLVAIGAPTTWLTRRVASIQQAALDRSAPAQREALHLFDLATATASGAELRVFGSGAEVLARHRAAWGEVEQIRRRADLRAAALLGSSGLLMTVGLVVVMVLIAGRATEGTVSPGDLVLTFGVLGQLTWQLRSLSATGGHLVQITSTARRLLRIEDLARTTGQQRSAQVVGDGAPPEALVHGIDLVGVSYLHPGSEVAAVEAVDLHLPAGSTVAIVGDNGAGKSTIAALLTGVRAPSTGRIVVDGVDLAAIDSDRWRERVSAAFQDHSRFELVAHETIGLGELSTLGDRDRAAESLEAAAGGDVSRALRDGLDTPLGTSLGGADLSGGQWQKLALARGLHRRDPLLLVLDEPTSALDPEAEHRLFETYLAAAHRRAESSGAITVVVSHRFSTVRRADLIVVVDRGRVIEHGTHEELRAAGGLYAEMYELQAGAYR